MTAPSTDKPQTATPPAMAAQLMVGEEQLRYFGEDAILACLDYTLDRLPLSELMLSIGDSAAALARKITSRCIARGVHVSSWTMVCADRNARLKPLPAATDFAGNGGYGSLGAWKGLGKGEEKFLFACPSALMDDDDGILAAVESASAIGATGLFLDRIRYPSPVNGLEFLGSCACPRCREAFRVKYGFAMPDFSALAKRHSAGGAEGARAFMAEGKAALDFRCGQIDAVVGRYAKAARGAGLRVGLDLFAPALSLFVGQDYARLSAHADFIKPMLYCKAFGPAGLPLEFLSLLKGLREVGTPRQAALDFVAALSGLGSGDLVRCLDGGTFNAGVAASEFARAKLSVCGSAANCSLYAGIELVDHEAYTTRIDDEARDAYLDAFAGEALALCWNILYIPRAHIDAMARRVSGLKESR